MRVMELQVNVTQFEPEWVGGTLENPSNHPLPAKVDANEGLRQIIPL
jgi:deoxycytidine triphosphate deaminase